MARPPHRAAARRARGIGAALAIVALSLALATSSVAAKRRHFRGPFANAAMRAFLRTRQGDITAAAYNLRTRRLFLYRPGVHGDDASIAKVDILATALQQAQADGTTLSAGEQELATAAIEESDNDAAQDLWDDVGGNPAIGAFNARIGMTQTILDPQGEWGYYESTALDQIRLLEHLVLPNPVLERRLAQLRARPDARRRSGAGVGGLRRRARAGAGRAQERLAAGRSGLGDQQHRLGQRALPRLPDRGAEQR